MNKLPSFVLVVSGLFLLAGWSGTVPDVTTSSPVKASPACVSADPEPPTYYQIELVGTRKVPGSRMAKGIGNITFAPSPYGIAISPEGTYHYDIDIQLEKAQAPDGKAFVAWISTPQLDQIMPIGRLDESLSIKGQVTFNKYLVVITLEPDTEPGQIWTGPVVARGMSRSGYMHTMAGHGPFVAEPCAVYGYR